MYVTQCVLPVGCKFTSPISILNGPSLKQIPTSFKDKDEKWLLNFYKGCCFKF